MPHMITKGRHTKAVDTLRLVGADDNTAQSGTLLKEEDSIGITTFRLTVAAAGATVKASVGLRRGVGLTSLDGDGLAERRGRWCTWPDVGGSALFQTTKATPVSIHWCNLKEQAYTLAVAKAARERRTVNFGLSMMFKNVGC